MESIKEIAHKTAWQIHEEIGLPEHSIERIEEIIIENFSFKEDNDKDYRELIALMKTREQLELLELKNKFEREAARMEITKMHKDIVAKLNEK